VKGVWAADAVKAKFKVVSPSSGGSPSSAAAAFQPSPQASEDWANFGSAPAAASAAGNDWAAFPSAPAVTPVFPARTAPVAAPRPAAAASLLDDLFTSAPASAPAVHQQHQQPAQAWGAPAPVAAPIATKPVTGVNLLDDLFSAVPAQATPIAQVRCHNRGLLFLSHFLLARMLPFSWCFVSVSSCNFSFAVLRNESWGVPSAAAATTAAVASAAAWISCAASHTT
jgi:hypothetical protein